MARDDLQDRDSRCGACGVQNLPFASFCIACGEPLGEDGDETSTEYRVPSTEYGAGGTGHPSLGTQYSVPVTRYLARYAGASPAHGDGDAPAPPSPLRAVSGRTPRHASLRWETLVGLLVLLLVTGYAVWDWQVTGMQSAAYREAVAAARSKDWDRALSGFDRAGGRNDAPQKKEEARRKVVERDHLYDEGVQAMGRHDLGAAISSLSQVQAIQPSYRDTARRLVAARTEVLKDGLQGVVYLVTEGPEPGLYLVDPRGLPLRLPLSDEQSAVRAVSEDDARFVYDRPSREADFAGSPPAHRTIVQDSFGVAKGDRIPVLVRLEAGGSVSTRPLPQLDPDGTGVLSGSGLWWYVGRHSGQEFGNDLELFYYDLAKPSGPGSLTRISDLASGKRVVALDPAHGAAVLAQLTIEPDIGRVGTRLYLARAPAPTAPIAPVPLQTVRGDIVSAAISPDGRRLLYVTWQYDLNPTLITAWVLPLNAGDAGNSEPRRLASVSLGSMLDTRHPAQLTAAFIPAGSEPSRVIVSRTTEGTEWLEAFDVNESVSGDAKGEGLFLWGGPHELGPVVSYPSGFSHDGAYLASVRPRPNGASLQVLGLGPGARSWSGDISTGDAPEVTGVRFAPRDDYLVLLAQGLTAEGTSAQSVYTVPAGKVGQNNLADRPRPVAQARIQESEDFPTIALPASGALLAYVNTKQELRSVFYDGSGDTLIATTVKAVWDLKGRPDLTWQR